MKAIDVAGFEFMLDEELQWQGSNQEIVEELNKATAEFMEDYGPSEGEQRNYVLHKIVKRFAGIVLIDNEQDRTTGRPGEKY